MNVNSTGASLLDYLNADSSSNSISSLLNANCATNTDATLYGLVKQTQNASLYESIQGLSEKTTGYLTDLTSDEKDSVWNETDTTDALKTIKNFVSGYNAMITAMNKEGSTTSVAYEKQLKQFLSDNGDTLKKIGITMNEDGKLAIDSDTLNSQSLTTLKEAFAGDTNLGNNLKDIIENITTVAADMTSKIGKYENIYNSLGGYSDSSDATSFYQSQA